MYQRRSGGSQTKSPMAFFIQQNLHPHKVGFPVQFLFQICVWAWQTINKNLENDLKKKVLNNSRKGIPTLILKSCLKKRNRSNMANDGPFRIASHNLALHD